MVDVWSGFADLMANLIAKYADVIDLEHLPDPSQDDSQDKDNEKRNQSQELPLACGISA